MAFKSFSTFVPGTCNTIDDVTGFKVKLSDCRERWDGVLTRDGWHPRQPQDFAVVPEPQHVFTNARARPFPSGDTEEFDAI